MLFRIGRVPMKTISKRSRRRCAFDVSAWARRGRAAPLAAATAVPPKAAARRPLHRAMVILFQACRALTHSLKREHDHPRRTSRGLAISWKRTLAMAGAASALTFCAPPAQARRQAAVSRATCDLLL